MKIPKFTLFISGCKDNDTLIGEWLGHKDYTAYNLIYCPPYEKFTGIKVFQSAVRYIPFIDSAEKEKIVSINVNEWIGHETEEYLHIFLKFLHDYSSYSGFDYHYIFTVSDFSKEQVLPFYRVALKYFIGGKIAENKTLINLNALSAYISSHFPVDEAIARKCSQILCGTVSSLAQVNLFLDDFIYNMKRPEADKLTEFGLYAKINNLDKTYLFMLYEKDMAEWKQNLISTKGNFFNEK